jgi:hypothetical protein
MNDRERFLACLLGEPVDRPPYWLVWGPWSTTWRRWQREGMPAEFTDFSQVRARFGSDAAPASIGVNCGPCPRFERTILHEDDNYVTFIDDWGIQRRDYKGGESMPQFIEFPIKSRADWEAYRDERLAPDDPERLAGNWRKQCADWAARGVPIQLGYYPDVGIFGSVRWLLGDEECLLAFYTMPDLVHEIMDHMTALYLTVFEKVVRDVRPDVIHIWEDMCGRQGPLISPKHWEEFMGPCYRRIKAFARAHDVRLLSVDTDGNPDLIIPPMMAAGVNYLYPMEVAAGCDVNVLRKRYPTLGMMGGIDKRAVAKGGEAIDKELARIKPAVAEGRYIPEFDHCIPDDVSWQDYCYYAVRLKELVGKE